MFCQYEAKNFEWVAGGTWSALRADGAEKQRLTSYSTDGTIPVNECAGRQIRPLYDNTPTDGGILCTSPILANAAF
jgi:hypothetical protein